jgi:hypothetical protein
MSLLNKAIDLLAAESNSSIRDGCVIGLMSTIAGTNLSPSLVLSSSSRWPDAMEFNSLIFLEDKGTKLNCIVLLIEMAWSRGSSRRIAILGFFDERLDESCSNKKTSSNDVLECSSIEIKYPVPWFREHSLVIGMGDFAVILQTGANQHV